MGSFPFVVSPSTSSPRPELGAKAGQACRTTPRSLQCHPEPRAKHLGWAILRPSRQCRTTPRPLQCHPEPRANDLGWALLRSSCLCRTTPCPLQCHPEPRAKNLGCGQPAGLLVVSPSAESGQALQNHGRGGPPLSRPVLTGQGAGTTIAPVQQTTASSVMGVRCSE